MNTAKDVAISELSALQSILGRAHEFAAATLNNTIYAVPEGNIVGDPSKVNELALSHGYLLGTVDTVRTRVNYILEVLGQHGIV